MEKFRKKPVVVEATQWFKNGDHPAVQYLRHPFVSDIKPCKHCGKMLHAHGWIDTLEGGHIVCPGDFVITGIQGECYPCKPDIFFATYESIDE